MLVIAIVAALSPTLWGQGGAVTIPQAPHASAEQQRLEALEKKLADWAQLSYYREANAAVPEPAEGEQRVVFYGASIVEFWKTRGAFFPGKPYIDRGISGQTTAQMLVRFRQDVIDLHPKAVVILGGTNDVAGNMGPMTPEMTEGNWQSMAELAKASGIAVIFASLTPSTDFPWRRGLKPAEKIRALNAWLRAYCEKHGATYLDVYSVLTDAEGGMKEGLSLDGVHPNAKGYALMEPGTQAAIDRALENEAKQ
jgi:lysophospholipase L1-like esterase